MGGGALRDLKAQPPGGGLWRPRGLYRVEGLWFGLGFRV